MAMEFSDKVALITGAASGIGKVVAQLLAERGARVLLADVQLQAVQANAQALVAQGHAAISCALDVTDEQSCAAAVDTALKAYGRLDLAVNNAGVATPLCKLADVSTQEWQRQIDVNLTGVFNCLRAEIPALQAAGGGAIVNLASILGVNGMFGRSAYVAAKHGVAGLTKAAALDYAEDRIRVNAVAPGYVDTPILQDRLGEERARIAALHALNRLSTPQEQAEAICFLLSDRASFITGSVMLNDGGFSAM